MEVTNNNLSSSTVQCGDSHPPEIYTIYKITTPTKEYVGIKAMGGLELRPLYYWNNPEQNLIGDTFISLIYIFDRASQEQIEKDLQPALFKYKNVYLPRFNEEEWRRTNRITSAFT